MACQREEGKSWGGRLPPRRGDLWCIWHSDKECVCMCVCLQGKKILVLNQSKESILLSSCYPVSSQANSFFFFFPFSVKKSMLQSGKWSIATLFIHVFISLRSVDKEKKCLSQSCSVSHSPFNHWETVEGAIKDFFSPSKKCVEWSAYEYLVNEQDMLT